MADRSFVDELNALLDMPIIVAPMFLISGPGLVIASAKAGLMGCFPAPNARKIEDLEQWLTRIDTELKQCGRDGRWGINMIVHKSYDRFDQELELIEQYRPMFVVTALGSPKRVLDRVHNFGGKVFCDVITIDQARKAVDAGVDGLILVCSGAGGHTGTLSPFSFIEEVRQFWDGLLVVGGAVSNARSINAMLALGADFVYMGTRFISCPESLVSDENRDMLVRAGANDVVTTAAVSGVKANWLKESLEKVGFDFDQVDAKAKIDFSNIQGDSKAWKDTWGAGEGVGSTRSVQSVAEIVSDLKTDFRREHNIHTSRLDYWNQRV
jgi:nitronate monooxygenase